MRKFISLAALCLLAVGPLQASGIDAGRNLAATCANCHGTNGRAVKGGGLDALAGLPKAQTLQKLAEFRSGARPATIMQQIVKGYTDAQLELIAAYFAAQGQGGRP